MHIVSNGQNGVYLQPRNVVGFQPNEPPLHRWTATKKYSFKIKIENKHRIECHTSKWNFWTILPYMN